jgi:hypothetical protein
MTFKNKTILETLASMPDGSSRSDLKMQLGFEDGYTRALGRYVDRGLVIRTGSRGTYWYRITQAGREHLLSDSGALRPDDKTHCEIWTGARWEILPVLAVYAVKDTATLRCYECHGPIVLMKPSDNGRIQAHFEHKPAHTGCSLVYRGRKNIPTNPPVPVSPPSDGEVSFPSYLPESIVEQMIDAAEDRTDDTVVGEVNGGASASIPESTEREQLRLARVGQGRFRNALKKRWRTCGVIGCGPVDVLVASHIHAWRLCETNKARLDVDNGILLTPNLDKLFDRGFISFAPDGVLLVVRHLNEPDISGLGLHPGMRLRIVHPGMQQYLKRHRATGDWIYFSSPVRDFDEAAWPSRLEEQDVSPA